MLVELRNMGVHKGDTVVFILDYMVKLGLILWNNVKI